MGVFTQMHAFGVFLAHGAMDGRRGNVGGASEGEIAWQSLGESNPSLQVENLAS